MKSVKYQTKTGVMQFRPILTKGVEVLISEGNVGFCLACGNDQDGCEPDARKYTCESCQAPKVYGLEELLMMGLLK